MLHVKFDQVRPQPIFYLHIDWILSEDLTQSLNLQVICDT